MESHQRLTRLYQSPGEQGRQFWEKWSGYESGNYELGCGVLWLASTAYSVMLESTLLRGKELL